MKNVAIRNYTFRLHYSKEEEEEKKPLLLYPITRERKGITAVLTLNVLLSNSDKIY
jgi:hypothetical protein